MALLTKDLLLQRKPPVIEKVDLGNDDFVCVREMSAHDRDEWERLGFREVKDPRARGRIRFERDTSDYRSKLAVFVICDEEGKLLFTPEDYPALSGGINVTVMDKILEVAQRINRLGQDDEARLGNSEGGPAASSASDSVES
jgi:hypothetical protein